MNISRAVFILCLLSSCLRIQSAFARQQQIQDSILLHADMAFRNEQYQRAVKLLNAFPGLSDTTLFLPHQAKALLLLSQSYEAIGAQDKAWEYFERYRIIKDSLFLNEKEKMIGRLEKNYATEKKDKAIAEQQLQFKKNETRAFRRRLIIWGGLSGGTLICMLCIISVNNYQKKQKINRKIREQMQHNHEIEQIQAHMKGTTEEREKIAIQLHRNVQPVIIQAANMLKIMEQNDATLKNAEHFSETRLILNEVEKSLKGIGLTQLNYEKDFTQLSATLSAFFDNLPANHDIDINFVCSGKEVPLPAIYVLHLKRIVQELVHNIIKHSAATHASIFLDYNSDALHLEVSDNGRGFKNYNNPPGMGISNIKKRLQELNGTMTIKESQGTKIHIIIPL